VSILLHILYVSSLEYVILFFFWGGICDIVAYNKSDTYGLMDARAVNDQRRRLLLVSDRTVAKETKTWTATHFRSHTRHNRGWCCQPRFVPWTANTADVAEQSWRTVTNTIMLNEVFACVDLYFLHVPIISDRSAYIFLLTRNYIRACLFTFISPVSRVV
jgi:hypothetical protein